VLKDLPAKIRTIVSLDPPNAKTKGLIESLNAEYERSGREIYERRQAALEQAKAKMTTEEYRQAVNALGVFDVPGLGEMSELRHKLAVAKVPQVIDFVKDMAENIPKIIVFAHHRDVIDELTKGLNEFNPVTVLGGMSNEARDACVQKFQNDPDCHIFIGGIMAAGVGLTLTAASNVVMAELDWSPGNVSQAEDRAHRIGQKDSVNVYHLVFDGSLDSHMAKMILRKQAAAEAALDTETGTKGGAREGMPELPKTAQPTNVDVAIPDKDRYAVAVQDAKIKSPQTVKDTPEPDIVIEPHPIANFAEAVKERLKSKAAPKRKSETVKITEPVKPIAPENPYIGKVGERANMHLKVDSHRTSEGHYGLTHHYNFVDGDGRHV
jgi:SWI/SNF-related matrix-associated actin-dependent regulator 1 of chromatin subfamily A